MACGVVHVVLKSLFIAQTMGGQQANVMHIHFYRIVMRRACCSTRVQKYTCFTDGYLRIFLFKSF